MNANKTGSQTHSIYAVPAWPEPPPHNNCHGFRSRKKKATQDELEMAYFGKRQKLRRTFGIVSTVGMCATIMSTWEAELLNFSGGLNNGGPVGTIAGFIFVWLGVMAQVLVMAEMGSMIPLAGGGYNWVSILAPEKMAPFLSYLTGWLTTLSWQMAIPSALNLAAGVVQGVAVLNNSSYVPERWQTVLILYGLMIVSLLVNTLDGRLLPMIEIVVFLIYIIGFFGILIPLLYLGPPSSAHEVFGVFLQRGGWDSKGVTFLVGATTTMYNFIGVESALQMAEEIEHASRVIPSSMIIATVLNGVSGLGMIIAVLFRLGDLQTALDTPTKFPFMEVLNNAVRSVPATTLMVMVVWSAMLSAAFAALATASRMMWAFAREGALPGSRFLSRVHPRSSLPLWSILASTIISILLSLLILGSTKAFNAFTNTLMAGFYSSFMIAAGAMLYRRLTNTLHIRWGPFRLGRAGIPLLIISMAYSMVAFVFAFFPSSPMPSATDMNWTIVVFGGTMVMCLSWWFLSARRTYHGPRVEISPDDLKSRHASVV